MSQTPSLKPLVDSYETNAASWTPDKAQADYQVALAKWQTDSDAAKAAGKRVPRKPSVSKDPHQDQHNPYLLYNGMIDPIKTYAIRGAIWYQGESNGPTANLYLEMMKTLIGSWRQAWGEGDFPFYEVQLAGYGKPTDSPIQGRSQIAAVRDAQLQTIKTVPNTAMATAVDIGDATTIHPKNKQEVGRRLSLIALNQIYGEKDTEFSGPIYDSMTVEGNQARIKFTHLGGGLSMCTATPSRALRLPATARPGRLAMPRSTATLSLSAAQKWINLSRCATPGPTIR